MSVNMRKNAQPERSAKPRAQASSEPVGGAAPQASAQMPQDTLAKPSAERAHAEKWVRTIFRHNLGHDPSKQQLASYTQQLLTLTSERKSVAEIQSTLVHRLRRTAEWKRMHATGLPPGISVEELHLVENAIYNEADGLSFTQQEKVAQAIRNYAKQLHTSVKNVVLGGRGGIAEDYLYDDPRHMKNGGADDTPKQAAQIHRAAIAGLNQEIRGFHATHWRGNGEENIFF